jgi:hypothetical protein
MPTPVSIVTGLAGAVGCDFQSALNTLIYVEYGGSLSSLNLAAPAHKVLGSGYTNPEDVELSQDGVHAYVDERSGDLVRVSLTSASRSAATPIASGMTAPQQIALDEAHNAAYVVEYAATGHLYRINLTTGLKTPVISTLNFAVGLVLSADLQYAYISEQTTGPDKGRVSRFSLSGGARTPLVTGLTAPFFLTWADAAQTTLIVPQRDPVNSITSIVVATSASTVIASGVPDMPSSVAMVNPGSMLICSNTEISNLNFQAFSGPLVMGIGNIPYNGINSAGFPTPVTTPPTPFGGALPLMVDYQAADAAGASWYCVRIDGVVRTDAFTDDYFISGTGYVPKTTTPTVVFSTQPGVYYYPVHPVSQLFDWLNPALGSMIDSTNLTSNAKHTIVVTFVNAAGVLVATSTPLTILVDNNPCVAGLGAPSIGSAVANSCGLLLYPAPTNTVSMGVTATQPQNFATYSFSVIRGVPGVVAASASGPVPAPSPIAKTVSALLGPCAPAPGIAAFAESVYVAASATNGWSRQSQYDASDTQAFVLVP